MLSFAGDTYLGKIVVDILEMLIVNLNNQPPDIMDNVFFAIQNGPLRGEYDIFTKSLTIEVTNKSISRIIKKK